MKFDLRIYALIYGVNPLRIYLYKEGLARFATETYVAPSGNNIDNLFMHLTNYAINKHSENYIYNENAEDNDVGHKRSLKAILSYLEMEDHDIVKLWNEIKDIIIKTLIMA